MLFITTSLYAQDKAGTAITKNGTGLLYGIFNASEAPAQTAEEDKLSLKPDKTISQDKPFWLYVPTTYKESKPLPLVIILHRRGVINGFSSSFKFTHNDLTTYAQNDLDAWKKLAEDKGIIIALPLGDLDKLWIGISWYMGDRSKLISALVENIQKTHSFDTSRLYLVGTGEGAHAVMSTAIKQPGLIAAATACNPPLFNKHNTNSKTTIFPASVDEMLNSAQKRKPNLLILAGKDDQKLKIDHHAIGGVKLNRYQDSSLIPASHIEKMCKQLRAGGLKNSFKIIEGKHHSPMPANQVPAIWDFLKDKRIPTTDQKDAAIINSELQKKINAELDMQQKAIDKLVNSFKVAKKAYSEKRFKEAIKEFNALLPKVSKKADIYYYLAKSHAQLHDKEKAITALQNAAKSGFNNSTQLKADKALAYINKEDGFLEVVKFIDNNNKQMEALIKMLKSKGYPVDGTGSQNINIQLDSKGNIIQQK